MERERQRQRLMQREAREDEWLICMHVCLCLIGIASDWTDICIISDWEWPSSLIVHWIASVLTSLPMQILTVFYWIWQLYHPPFHAPLFTFSASYTSLSPTNCAVLIKPLFSSTFTNDKLLNSVLLTPFFIYNVPTFRETTNQNLFHYASLSSSKLYS